MWCSTCRYKIHTGYVMSLYLQVLHHIPSMYVISTRATSHTQYVLYIYKCYITYPVCMLYLHVLHHIPSMYFISTRATSHTQYVCYIYTYYITYPVCILYQYVLHHIPSMYVISTRATSHTQYVTYWVCDVALVDITYILGMWCSTCRYKIHTGYVMYHV
jgi:hypothetical protein